MEKKQRVFLPSHWLLPYFSLITYPMRFLLDVLKANMQFQLEKELGEWPEMERL